MNEVEVRQDQLCLANPLSSREEDERQMDVL